MAIPTQAWADAAASCPAKPKIGRTVTVEGRIARLDKGGTQGIFFVQDCRIIIFAQGDLKACRKGKTITARGRVQLYDLYPTMESFFINPRSVKCG